MSTSPAWKAVCRQRAYAQAIDEARGLWRGATGGGVLFNHRWEHVREVARLAMWLARAAGAELQTVEAAAWLHDVRKTEPSHGIAGAEAARAILAETDFPPQHVEAVADAIRQHVGLYRPPGTPPMAPIEAAVLWDADKLTKLGVQALAFYLSSPYDLELDLSQRRQRLASFASDVLARSVDSMNTDPAKILAARRHREMIATLETWARDETEIGK